MKIMIVCLGIIIIMASLIIADTIEVNNPLIDPVYIYKQVLKKTPVYSDKVISVSPYCTIMNDEEICYPATEYTEKTLIRYDYDLINTKEVEGVLVSDKLILAPANVKDNKVYVWKYPQGERNMESYGECRDFELRKGVCWIDESISLGVVKK